MGGADVVAYFSLSDGDDGIFGSKNHSVMYKSHTFYFSNDENAKTFTADPTKYMPAWGGF